MLLCNLYFHIINLRHRETNQRFARDSNVKFAHKFVRCRGAENRTQTKGFGDPYDTISPRPYV